MSKESNAQSPLDQLESMINLVLQQTGQLFHEGAKGRSDTALAYAQRLKQGLPRILVNYNVALDRLQDDLSTARRAVQHGYSVQLKRTAEPGIEADRVSSDNNVDVSMTDLDDGGEPAITTTEDAPTSTSPAPTEPSKEPSVQQSQATLKIDTSAKQPSPGPEISSTAEPTTAYSTRDLDSLFNESGSGAPNSADETPTRNADLNETTATHADQDFSFASFNNKEQPEMTTEGNDNEDEDITSLLPGLESYANESVDAQMDFGGESKAQDETGPQVPAQATDGMQRDTTFDDIMNFGDFDYSGFDTGDANLDDDGTKFDDDFFNLE